MMQAMGLWLLLVDLTKQKSGVRSRSGGLREPNLRLCRIIPFGLEVTTMRYNQLELVF